MKKQVFYLLLAFMLFFSCGAPVKAESGADAFTEEPLISNVLPVDFSGGIAPLPEGYHGEGVYEDASIRVSVEYKDVSAYAPRYQGREAGAWVVDIRIGNASQLRTAPAVSFERGNSSPMEKIADRVNAVVAINGDSATLLKEGLIIRQGIAFRDKLKGHRDVLLIDEDGDFHVFHLPKKGDLSDTVDGKAVVNAFYFGPILVENGEALKRMPDFQHLDPEEYLARIAICQIGPLHYKLIVTTMIVDYTIGLRLEDFARLCADEGAQVAYNLDGGLSSSLYFKGQRVNSQNKINFRDVPDIIYFVTAFNWEVVDE